MAIELKQTKKDDPEFIHLLSRVLNAILAQAQFNEFYVITVDNWFDHKWLNFSGIGGVTFEFPEFMHMDGVVVTDEFHQDKITLPPFSPSRVICQRYFCKHDDGYLESELPVPLHKRQRSEKNLQRRIEDISDSACFVWYSSNSLSNERASVMMYTIDKAHIETWFATFKKVDGWKLDVTKGISRERVQRFLSPLLSFPKS